MVGASFYLSGSYFMLNHILIILREDPTITHRPVEGLRIALGLSTGTTPLTILLLGKACFLITENALEDVVDAEILEKHLPVIQDLGIPIIVPKSSREDFDFDPDFTVIEASFQEIQEKIAQSDRVMVLG